MFITRTSHALLRMRASTLTATRMMATDAPAKPSPKPTAGLLGRISSFFVGAGVTALGTQFYIYQELANGNKMILAKQAELEQRLEKLEK